MPPVWSPPRPALHRHPTYALLLLDNISLPPQALITQPPHLLLALARRTTP